MKINKIREMSSPDLEKELGELKSELFKLRFSLATNGLDNPMKIKEVKKDIAKIKTVLTQREMSGEEVVAAPAVKEEVKTEETAREALRLAMNKLPIKCKFVVKETESKVGDSDEDK